MATQAPTRDQDEEEGEEEDEDNTQEKWAKPLNYWDIQALAQCKRLHTLQMSHPLPITLSGEDLVMIGGWWPKLRVLELSQSPHSDYEPLTSQGISFTALKVFGQHFPRLQSLGLFLSTDLSKENPLMTDLGPLWTNYALCRLHIGRSMVPAGGDVFAIGRYISILFPGLGGVETGSIDWWLGLERKETAEPRRTEWARVSDTLRAMNLVQGSYRQCMWDADRKLQLARREIARLKAK